MTGEGIRRHKYGRTIVCPDKLPMQAQLADAGRLWVVVAGDFQSPEHFNLSSIPFLCYNILVTTPTR